MRSQHADGDLTEGRSAGSSTCMLRQMTGSRILLLEAYKAGTFMVCFEQRTTRLGHSGEAGRLRVVTIGSS